MTRTLFIIFLLFTTLLPGCGEKPDAPVITLGSVEGATIELNSQTPLTAVFFFSMSNPVALGAFDRFPDSIHRAAETVGIALHRIRRVVPYGIELLGEGCGRIDGVAVVNHNVDAMCMEFTRNGRADACSTSRDQCRSFCHVMQGPDCYTCAPI